MTGDIWNLLNLVINAASLSIAWESALNYSVIQYIMTTMTMMTSFTETAYLHPLIIRLRVGRSYPAFVIAFFLSLFTSGVVQALTFQASATEQPILSTIQLQKDTLIVGSEQDYPPFATGMTDATAGGFTVDLWKAVAAEAGLKYSIHVRPFHQILQEFKEGKVDVLINLAQSAERRQFADFTVPHVIVHGAIFVRKGESRIRSEDDLIGKSIIVLKADLAHDYAVSKGWEKQLILVNTSAEGMRLLASGQHDVMLLSKLAGMQTLHELGLTSIKALQVKAGFSQKFAFAVPKGQSDLLSEINEGLALTKSNGTYNALYDKWFGVYEIKDVGLRDLLKYIIPMVVVFMGISGYFFYRRKVEREEAENKYRDLYDHAPDMFLSVEAKSANLINFNQTLLNTTGYSRKELAGRPVFELYHPDCVDLARSAFQQFMETKELYGVELQLRRKDGSKVDVSLNASAVCDKHGAILYSRSTLRDITERKQAEEMLRNLFIAVEQSPASVVITDLEACIQYVNSRFTKVTGYTAAEAIGQNPRILQSGQTTQKYYLDLWDKLSKGQAWHGELLNKRKNGELYWEESHIAPVKNSVGVVTHYVAVKTDITERKRLEAALAESNNLLMTVIDTAPIRVFWKDHNLRYLGCNMAFAKDAGMMHPMDVIGKDDYQMGWAAQAELYRADDRAVMESGIAKLSYDEPQTTPSGQMIWLRTSKVQLKNQNNEVSGLLGIYEEITERKQAEEKLQFAASVFTHAREGIMITAADGTIIDVNDTFTSITGYSLSEVLGRNPRLLSSGRQGKEFYDTMWSDLLKNGHWYGEVWNRRKNGEVFAEMLTISAVRDAQNNPQHYVALFSDITSIKQHEQQLEHIAHYDTLTSLPNRVLLADRLSQAMAQAQRRSQRLAVAFLDLDGFKAVNDNHGHEAGDQLLITVATHMKQALREGDTLARLGGDEFVAVLLDLADIEASVPMLTRLLTAAAQPVPVGDLILQVSASLGVTFYPQAEDVNADQLLRQADQAMYQAKLAGKNRYYVFDAALNSNIRSHHESLDRIRLALTKQEFVLYYQPKVNLRTGMIIGAEALIRWQHPQKGLLPPVAFLPVIEDHSLAIDIGEWVIDTALAQIEIWHTAGLNIPVSVNVGARQLQQPDFVERLRTLLATHPHIRPGDLELEVLETSALDDVVGVSHVIEDCRKIGVSFALDDFGTGYSSLTYLRRLPVALLKIDQTFVRDMLDDPDDLAIIEGVVSLARTFRREVIAEGVETVEHGTMLLQLGCELAQGYGIARPMPASQLHSWSTTWQPDAAWVDQSSVSRDNLPLLFASVEQRSWIGAIEGFLKGERDAPLAFDSYQSRFSMWMNTESLANHSAQPAFVAIDSLHRQIQALATELCELQILGRKSEALARLDELYDLRDALLDQLKVPTEKILP